MSKYLTNQLRVDTPENRCDLIAGEVAGELLYGLNVVEDPDAAVGGSWRWSDLDEGAGLE